MTDDTKRRRWLGPDRTDCLSRRVFCCAGAATILAPVLPAPDAAGAFRGEPQATLLVKDGWLLLPGDLG